MKSEEFHYELTYAFISRCWNRSLLQILSDLKLYDLIITNSQVWDLTRYNDYDGKVYLKNKDILFSNLKQIEKKIVWMTTPPVDGQKHQHLKKLLVATNEDVLAKVKLNDFYLLDLYRHMKNQLALRNNDGLHWLPEGHRLMSQFLIDAMGKVFVQQETIDVSSRSMLEQSPSNSHIRYDGKSTNYNFLLQWFSFLYDRTANNEITKHADQEISS